MNYIERSKDDKDVRLLNDKHPTFNERFGGEICLKIKEMTPEVLKKIERGRFAMLVNFLRRVPV